MNVSGGGGRDTFMSGLYFVCVKSHAHRRVRTSDFVYKKNQKINNASIVLKYFILCKTISLVSMIVL